MHRRPLRPTEDSRTPKSRARTAVALCTLALASACTGSEIILHGRAVEPGAQAEAGGGAEAGGSNEAGGDGSGDAKTPETGCGTREAGSLDGATTPVVVKAVDLSPTSHPSGIAVDSETNLVYLSDQAGSSISIFDGDLSQVGTIATPPEPARPALDTRPCSRRLFVGHVASTGVEVFSLSADVPPVVAPLCSIGGTTAVPRLAFNPDTEKLYQAAGADACLACDVLNVLDGVGKNCHLKTTLPQLGDSPDAMVIDRAANRIYVSILHDQKVSVIDGNDDSFVQDIMLSVIHGDPNSLALDPARHRLYVGYNLASEITQIDTGPSGSGPFVQTSLPLGGQSGAYLTDDPDLDRVYFSTYGANQLGVVSGGALQASLPLPGLPDVSALNTRTHCLYVVAVAQMPMQPKIVKVCPMR